MYLNNSTSSCASRCNGGFGGGCQMNHRELYYPALAYSFVKSYAGYEYDLSLAHVRRVNAQGLHHETVYHPRYNNPLSNATIISDLLPLYNLCTHRRDLSLCLIMMRIKIVYENCRRRTSRFESLGYMMLGWRKSCPGRFCLAALVLAGASVTSPHSVDAVR